MSGAPVRLVSNTSVSLSPESAGATSSNNVLTRVSRRGGCHALTVHIAVAASGPVMGSASAPAATSSKPTRPQAPTAANATALAAARADVNHRDGMPFQEQTGPVGFRHAGRNPSKRKPVDEARKDHAE